MKYLVLLALAACQGTQTVPQDAAPMTDAIETVDASDAACPKGCAPETDEDCSACWKHIGVCCYDDPSILGRVVPLTQVCEARPSCKVCCNECASLPCDVLLARHACPNRF